MQLLEKGPGVQIQKKITLAENKCDLSSRMRWDPCGLSKTGLQS